MRWRASHAAIDSKQGCPKCINNTRLINAIVVYVLYSPLRQMSPSFVVALLTHRHRFLPDHPDKSATVCFFLECFQASARDCILFASLYTVYNSSFFFVPRANSNQTALPLEEAQCCLLGANKIVIKPSVFRVFWLRGKMPRVFQNGKVPILCVLFAPLWTINNKQAKSNSDGLCGGVKKANMFGR